MTHGRFGGTVRVAVGLWALAGCSKEQAAPPEIRPVEAVKPPEEPKPVEIVKPPEEPKPVETVKPSEEPKPVEKLTPPSASRAESLAAFEKKCSRLFGGERGIQSPLGVRKLNDSWEASLKPLLGEEKFKSYAAKYPLESSSPADAEGGKRKRKAGKKAVTPAARQAVQARLKGSFDTEWGVADADLPKLHDALVKAFETAKGGPIPGDEPPPAATPATPPEGGTPAETPPAASGTGGPSEPNIDRGPSDGFAIKATGGGGAPWKVVPPKADAISAALRAGGNVRVEKGDVDAPYNSIVVRANSTLDGGGATFWFPASGHNGKGVTPSGDNIVIRNFRVRNSGDNVCFGSMSHASSNVLCENVSSTGSGDDGISPSYKCHDITVRWTFVGGCTRAIFMKYGPKNITFHHTIVTHYWMRGPLVSGDVTIDFRNNLVQHWSMFGSRLEGGARGNFVGNTYRLSGWEHGGAKKDGALYTADASSKIFADGNDYLGCSPRPEGFSKTPVVDAPPVPTEDAKAALARILDEKTGAGCMPRDDLDKTYMEWTKAWPPHPQDKSVTHGLAVPGSRLENKAEPKPPEGGEPPAAGDETPEPEEKPEPGTKPEGEPKPDAAPKEGATPSP